MAEILPFNLKVTSFFLFAFYNSSFISKQNKIDYNPIFICTILLFQMALWLILRINTPQYWISATTLSLVTITFLEVFIENYFNILAKYLVYTISFIKLLSIISIFGYYAGYFVQEIVSFQDENIYYRAGLTLTNTKVGQGIYGAIRPTGFF